MVQSRFVAGLTLAGLVASPVGAAVRPEVASMRTAPVVAKASPRAATRTGAQSDLAGSALLIPLLGGLVVVVAVAVAVGGGGGNVSPR